MKKKSLRFALGDRHEIRNSGTVMLHTLNFYVPTAYTPGGAELPRGKGAP